jgi:hypothetical protein
MKNRHSGVCQDGDFLLRHRAVGLSGRIPMALPGAMMTRTFSPQNWLIIPIPMALPWAMMTRAVGPFGHMRRWLIRSYRIAEFADNLVYIAVTENGRESCVAPNAPIRYSRSQKFMRFFVRGKAPRPWATRSEGVSPSISSSPRAGRPRSQRTTPASTERGN